MCPTSCSSGSTRNTQHKLELHLFTLSRIPDTVLDLAELEVLKLELTPDVAIPPNIAQLTGQQKQWLYHMAAKIQAPTLLLLRRNMWAQHIMDIKEIPLWIYSLKSLEDPHLTSNLSVENNRYIIMHELEELKHLMVVWLKSNLRKLSQVATDVGVYLQMSINYVGSSSSIASRWW